jgi:predicted GNAT family N-acyltransferase
MREKFDIQLLDWAQAQPGAAQVRRSVFIEEQGVPEYLEWDELDARAVHALCIDASGRSVGTGRLIVLPEAGGAVIGRMAVLIPHRSIGLGNRMLCALLDRVEAMGRSTVVLHAQVAVLPFYRHCGFRAVGPVFEEAGIAHRRMTLSLSNRKR